MTLAHDRRYWLTLGAILLSLAVVAWAGLRTGQAARDHEAFETRIQARSAQTQRVLATMLDLRAGVLAYVLTADPASLAPYREASSHLDRDLETLEEMRRESDDGSLPDARRLSALAATERAQLQRAIDRVDARDVDGAHGLLRGVEVKARMDDIRALVARLVSADALQLAAAQGSKLSAIDLEQRVLMLVGLTLTLLMAMLWLTMHRERANRRRAEEADACHVATLELRVSGRTAELSAALEALQVAEKRQRAIVDAAFDGIVTADETHTIVQANAAAAAMFGTTERALLGSPIERLVPERLRARHAEHMKALERGGPALRRLTGLAQVWGLRSDGTEFPIEASISRVAVEGQRLYTAVLRDVTEARRAREEVEVGKAKLEAALASISDAVFISDAGGTFTHFNDAFVRFHRFPNRAEALRRLPDYPQLLEVRTADGRVAPFDRWAVPRALHGESATSVEYGLQRTDTGEAWTGSFSFAPIRDADGTVVGSVVVGRDVSEVKRMQAELERSHAALRRLFAEQDRVQEQERARIARDLHDDLQQTLSAVNLDLVSARARMTTGRADPLPLIESARRLTLEAIASTRRIVTDLRPPLLDELGLLPALQQLAARAQQHMGIPCTVEPREADDSTLGCRADVATCVYRVVQEALNNVGKHARATTVRIGVERVDADLVVRVADDGCGIGAEDRGKLWSFGLLGMAERAHAVGGELSVRGEAGRGTRVELRVPVGTGEAASARSAAHDAPRPAVSAG